jgi:hypothetical protein
MGYQIHHRLDKNKIIIEVVCGAIGRCIEAAVKQEVSFAHADLRSVNLDDRDLRGGNFAGADFRNADLNRTNFRGANLLDAEFHGASMKGMDIRGAGIDFASWPLWCGNQSIIMDEEQAKQFLAHVFNAAEAFWPGGLTDEQKDWLNSFRRIRSKFLPEFI